MEVAWGVIDKVYAHIAQAGGRAYMVGGSVRDAVIGHEPKDIDTEVYGMDADLLIAILRNYASSVNTVGASFGVIKARIGNGEYDFSLPRRDNKTGQGHRGFMVDVDSSMTLAEAAGRRDYRINAISAERVVTEYPCPVCNGSGRGYPGMDYSGVCDECGGQGATEAPTVTLEFIDPYDGMADLKTGVLRHTSAAFAEDPLRVLRGMQFAARMGLRVARETAALCYQIRDEYPTLATERVWGEWYKLATKGITPSLGMAFLYSTKWVYLYPELSALIGLAQEPEWHQFVLLATVPLDSLLAGVAASQSVDPRLATFRQFVAATPADQACVKSAGRATLTETIRHSIVGSFPSTV